MATMTRRGAKRWQIQFQDLQGQRRSITLRCAYDAARDFKARLEKLLEHRRVGAALPPGLAGWAAGLDAAVRQKLAALDLVPPPKDTGQGMTLGQWLERLWAKVERKSRSSRLVFKETRRHLLDFFGPDRPLDSITRGDAQDFVEYLKTAPKLIGGGTLAPYTAKRRLTEARGIFQAAVDHELIRRNPFQGLTLPGPIQDRTAYISPEQARRLIEAMPNVGWRTLVALVRFGGLRCPTEVFSLRWEHVRFDQDLMYVPQPKLAHLPGKEQRTVPIFAALRPYLQEAWEAAEPGGEYVVNLDTYRQAYQKRHDWRDVNPATHFKRLVRKAGMEPWAKPFHNLRASCETDLAEHYPQHVVCCWLGNSEPVAREHYLQVHEEHYRRAAQQPTGPAPTVQQPLQTAAHPAAPFPGTGGNRVEVPSAGDCPNLEPGGKLPQVVEPQGLIEYALQDSNLQPSVP